LEERSGLYDKKSFDNFAKRIMDLRKGFVEVISTRHGKETFRYDTLSNATEKVEEGQPQGTAFALYFPKAL
jgi:hypothetical protein